MQPVDATGHLASANTARVVALRTGGNLPSPPPSAESIAEAERRGNLVIVGIAMGLLALVLALATS